MKVPGGTQIVEMSVCGDEVVLRHHHAQATPDHLLPISPRLSGDNRSSGACGSSPSRSRSRCVPLLCSDGRTRMQSCTSSARESVKPILFCRFGSWTTMTGALRLSFEYPVAERCRHTEAVQRGVLPAAGRWCHGQRMTPWAQRQSPQTGNVLPKQSSSLDSDM